MAALSLKLRMQLKSILRSTFTIKRIDENKILFKSLKTDRDEFYLSRGVLTDFELLEIAKILAEVYSSFPVAEGPAPRFSASARDLNLDSALSGQLVGTVLSLESSALHKLLLLTSGHSLLILENSDLIISLAQNKKEMCSSPEDMLSNNRIYNILKNVYILPGVSTRTIIPSFEHFVHDLFKRGSVELVARLTAFFAKNSEDLTLGEHLAMDFVEGIQSQKSLANLNRLFTVPRILLSNYRTMIESMTAIEVHSLALLLPDWDSKFIFPERVLRNRSKAISQGEMKRTKRLTYSVSVYLSDVESKSLSSMTFIQKLNNLITDYSRSLEPNTPPLIYAALAEVLVVKGERKALDVANELVHLKLIKSMTTRIYAATVALIAEALNPENDDYPFSWTSQMSEHSWVLTSHLSEKELALKV